MFRKNYFILLSAIGVVLLSTLFASAQIVIISGRVDVEKEDGTKESVAGALVEIYQVGIKSGSKSDTTDKSGNFKFIGVPPGSNFLLTVSGEGLEPVIINISAGMENQIVTVRTGDGTRWTEDQVRGAPTGGGGSGELTPEQKAEQARIEKERAEIEARNKRIEQANTIIPKVLKEGNDAFNAKNYELAIAKFQEGYDLTEDYAGTAPVLLNNKAVTYRTRAVDYFNAGVTTKDAEEKKELKAKAKQDFENSLIDYYKSWMILKKAKASDVQDQKVFEKAKTDSLSGGNIVVSYMVRTELVAVSKTEEAKELVNQFTDVESDKAKKVEAQNNLGRFLLGAGDFDGSIAAYRAAVAISPKDADALAGLGLALYSASFEKEELKQESLNYMQYFLDVSPKNHSFRESIQGAVDDLKSQKLKPQKVSKN